MFALQVALLKDRGGIDTALLHYARMFDAVGVRHGALYRGPALGDFRAAGIDALEAPDDLTSPLFAFLGAAHLREEIAARAKGEPVVAIIHSDMALPAVRAIAPAARLVAPCHSDKAKRKRAAHVVVTLNSAQHALVENVLAGSRARAFMLGNPFVEAERSTAKPDGPLRINFCARFTPIKDPLTAVRAVAAMAQKPLLRLIGSGELEAEARALAASLGVDAEFPGWRADPFGDFTRGDVLVLPSSWEGLPYLLQEALVRGVPIIASDIAGNRLALGDGEFGMLFPHGDANALAACIKAGRADLDGLIARAEKGRAALPARYGASAFYARLSAALAETAA